MKIYVDEKPNDCNICEFCENISACNKRCKITGQINADGLCPLIDIHEDYVTRKSIVGLENRIDSLLNKIEGLESIVSTLMA